MRKQETIELTLITLAILSFTSLSDRLPHTVNLGQLIVFLALTLLLHGFLRDLYLLYKQKTQSKSEPPVEMRCMCLESTIGLTFILIGVACAILFSRWQVILKPYLWSLFFAVVLIFGFLTKEMIITWNPFSIRKEKDHANIIFKF